MLLLKIVLILLVTLHCVISRSLNHDQHTTDAIREITEKISHHWLSKLQVFSLNSITTNQTSITNEFVPRLNDTVMMLFCENLKYLLPDALFLPPMSILETFTEHTLVYTEIFNGNISNLADYKVDHAHANMPSADQCTMQFQFDYGYIRMQGYYELDVSNPYVHVYGNGPYSIILKDVNVSVTADFHVVNGTLNLHAFDLDFNITDLQANFSNLYNDEGGIINSFVHNFTLKATDTFKPDIRQLIENKTITYGNYILQYFIMDNLIDFILYIAGV